MQIVLIIALIVAVGALFYVAVEQGYTIQKYERELMEKSDKKRKKK